MAGPSKEELLAMSGGVSADDVFAAPSAIQAQGFTAPRHTDKSNDSTVSVKDLNAFAGGTLEDDIPNGANMQYSSVIEESINAGGNPLLGNQRPRQQQQQYNQAPVASTPYERFVAFVKYEESLSDEFDFGNDVYDMVDYMIEQEKLAAKFGRFTKAQPNQVEEDYYE